MYAHSLNPIILLLVFAVLVVLPLVLICVFAVRKGTQPAAPSASLLPSIDPAERNRRREAILERLAAKEIAREEAEQQLLELDRPLPEQMPTPPPRKASGCGTGCLVAAIVIGVLFFLLLLSFVGLRFVAPRHMM